MGGTTLVIAAVFAAGAWYWHGLQPSPSGTVVMTPEKPNAMDTNGGQLGVAIVTAKERFTKKDSKEIFGVSLGKTVSIVQVGVTYRYYIEMARRWPVDCDEKTCMVHAPEIKPSLPVAFDTATMEKYTKERWFRFNRQENLDSLERSITAELQNRVGSPQYEGIVTDAARITVKAFVSTWVEKQKRWAIGRDPKVIVLFPGETVESTKQEQL